MEEKKRKEDQKRKKEVKNQLNREEKKRKEELVKEGKMRGKKRKAEEEIEQEEEKEEESEMTRNSETTNEENSEKLDEKQKKEKNDRELEEQINEALIRKCVGCGFPFMKDGGSNRVICRCGMTQYYVCRQSNIDHDHFCKHPRDPNVTNCKCNQCANKCMLYQDADQIDAELIAEIRNRHKRKEAGEGEATSQN